MGKYYVIFFIHEDDHRIRYVDNYKFNDMEPYDGVEDINLAEHYTNFEDAVNACRYIYVGHMYIRAVSTGWANGGII